MLSLGAAVSFALASVFQFKASGRVSKKKNLRLALIGHLVLDPGFLSGVVFDVIGSVLQFIALKVGTVVVVLPVIASGFMMAIALEHLLAKQPIKWKQALALCVAGASLVGFLVTRPITPANVIDSPITYVVALVAIAMGAWALSIGRGRVEAHGIAQAVLGALLLGVTAVLERDVGLQWTREGWIQVLAHGEVYLLMCTGAAALILVQSAFQLRALATVLPILTVGEPIVALVLGVWLLSEPLITSRTNSVMSAGLLALEIGALFYLAYSERVTDLTGDP